MNADHLQTSSVHPEVASLPLLPVGETDMVTVRTWEFLDETISEEGFAELERELACSSQARAIYLEIVQMHVEIMEEVKNSKQGSSSQQGASSNEGS